MLLEKANKMKDLITIKDFCERFSVSRSTFYRQRAAGILPIRKVGRSTRIRVSDAETWASKLEEAA
jgi:excisionase family DNA binding protein